MGKKYIIEIEDKPFHKEDGDFLYRVKGFNSLVFDMTGIGMLTPYTEPDLERVRLEAEQLGMVLAWDAAEKIENLCEAEKFEIFGEYDMFHIMRRYTAAEAIEKIRQYEQEKEEKQHTWIFSEVNEPSVNTTLTCSKCGYTITIEPGDTQALNFCPKCGDNKRGE